jgi:glycosyltransferase involved in cell wall biosynthesis
VSKAWSAQTEVDDLNQFDIGIMTIPNDEWAKGKCGLKGLSYIACGVATVMSPVGVNTDIIQHGVNGYLAGTNQEWMDCLSLLIESLELRQQIGKAGRDTVVQNYSVNANKLKYVEVLKSLIK